EHVPVVLVGLPPERYPHGISCINGRLPRPNRRLELVVGTELARRLKLQVGDLLPPFYHNRNGDRVAEVVGLFDSEVSLWQANLGFTTFEMAAAIFDQSELATDLLVDCRPGYESIVADAILHAGTDLLGQRDSQTHLRVTTRQSLEAVLPAGLM